MKPLKIGVVVVLFCSLHTSCKNSNQSHESNEDATHSSSNIQAEIEAQWSSFITLWEQEDAYQLANFYHQDGINVPNEFKANVGREAIAQFYEFLFNNNLSSRYQHQLDYVEVRSDMAIEYGNFKVHWVRNDSTEWTYSARTVTHWQKDDNDQWKIKLFLFNKPPENPN